jgi:hypothetical protein
MKTELGGNSVVNRRHGMSGFCPRRAPRSQRAAKSCPSILCSSHAKSLWSRDVPERRDNLAGVRNARFQKELFKMTFASSNPPDPSQPVRLKPRFSPVGSVNVIAMRGTPRSQDRDHCDRLRVRVGAFHKKKFVSNYFKRQTKPIASRLRLR